MHFARLPHHISLDSEPLDLSEWEWVMRESTVASTVLQVAACSYEMTSIYRIHILHPDPRCESDANVFVTTKLNYSSAGPVVAFTCRTWGPQQITSTWCFLPYPITQLLRDRLRTRLSRFTLLAPALAWNIQTRTNNTLLPSMAGIRDRILII